MSFCSASLASFHVDSGVPSHLFHYEDYLISFADSSVKLWSAKDDAYSLLKTVRMFDLDGSSAKLFDGIIIAAGSDSGAGGENDTATKSVKVWKIRAEAGGSDSVPTLGSPSQRVGSILTLKDRSIVTRLREHSWVAEIWC